MANKIKFKIKSDKFSDFINKLEDLTKISDTIKLKIDNDNILMYSLLGGNVMLAFKNYLINTRDYLEYGDDMEYSMDVIIANAKKFVKNLNFIKESDKITLEISYKESQDDDSEEMGEMMPFGEEEEEDFQEEEESPEEEEEEEEGSKLESFQSFLKKRK